MKENNVNMVELIKDEYERKYNYQCSIELATELLNLGENDGAMVIRTIQRTDKNYKLKEFIEANTKQKTGRKEQHQKKDTAYTEQLKWMFEPFLDDKTIDLVQYNAIIAQRQGLPHNQNDYQQGMFFIHKQIYKHPIQWVRGLGLMMWEEQAFAQLVSEQQENFNLDLIRKAGVQYQKDFTPDSDITPLAIQKMFGLQRVEIEQGVNK